MGLVYTVWWMVEFKAGKFWYGKYTLQRPMRIRHGSHIRSKGTKAHGFGVSTASPVHWQTWTRHLHPGIHSGPGSMKRAFNDSYLWLYDHRFFLLYSNVKMTFFGGFIEKSPHNWVVFISSPLFVAYQKPLVEPSLGALFFALAE